MLSNDKSIPSVSLVKALECICKGVRPIVIGGLMQCSYLCLFSRDLFTKKIFINTGGIHYLLSVVVMFIHTVIVSDAEVLVFFGIIFSLSPPAG